MEKRIELLSHDQRSREWYNTRNMYIGASEIGTLLNIDENKSVKDLLISKLRPSENKNSYTAIGSMFENAILSMFQYYENDPVQTYDNYINDNKIREVHKENKSYLLYLDGIPFMVSPDGYTINNENKMVPVEVKFISDYSSKKHIDNTGSGKYAWQSVMQQLVYDINYGYIFTLVSNNNMIVDIVELERFQDLLSVVISKAKEFYEYLFEYKDKSLHDIVKYCYPEIPILSDKLISDEDAAVKIEETQRYIDGDEEDERYAEMYFNMNQKELEMKKNKEAIKNYFKYKYGDFAQITAGIYHVSTKKPFKISLK